jgi:hypothetical protein
MKTPRITRLAPALALLLAGCSGDDGTPTDTPPPPPPPPPPTLEIGLDADSALVFRGGTAEVGIVLAGGPGAGSSTTLTVSGGGEGLVATFADNPVTGTQATLRLEAARDADTGDRALTLSASSGTQTAQVSLPIRIPERFPGEPEWGFAPGVVGEVRTLNVFGGEVTIEVIDGMAILEGDVILGEIGEVEGWATWAAGAAPGDDGPLLAAICTFDHFRCERWTDGIMGYAFANDWGSAEDNANMRSMILAAMDHWEENTPIRFEPRESGERVVFRNSEGCSSMIGRRVHTGFEPQYINMSTGCGFGAAVHEIAHAIGLHHEQSRHDRDDFVRIIRENIQDGRGHNFNQYWSGHGADIGPYNFQSIMHYGCGAFGREPGLRTLEPIAAGVTCGDIGSGVLSEGDILGVYWLYPPAFTIEGASHLDVGPVFNLRAEFSTPPVRSSYIQWTSSLHSGVIGTGPQFTLRSADHNDGLQTITASVRIAGTVVASRQIQLVLGNEPPSVDLGGDRTVPVNRLFFVTATVEDREDGNCPLNLCNYSWFPSPDQGGGGAVGYRMDEPGTMTIRVEVEDSGGAVGTDSIRVTAVNSPPVPVIAQPSGGSSFSEGSSVVVSGSATDANEGPGPGPGPLPCEALSWRSSAPSDQFSGGGIGCGPTLTFGTPGTRNLTLTATDSHGAEASTSVTVTVTACAGNCIPDVILNILTSPDFDDSSYSQTFTEPGYYLGTDIQLQGLVVDADVPPDSPVQYRWSVIQPCFGSCPPDIELGSGSAALLALTGSVTLNRTWRPSNNLSEWGNCITVPLAYTIRLEVTDSRGASNSAQRTVMLACVFGQQE